MTSSSALGRDAFTSDTVRRSGDIAIIGMAGLFPHAPTLATYWQNILSRVDAITDPPSEAWDPALHYDPDSADNDRIYCKRGGFLGPVAFFNPLDHGVMPLAVDGGEPDQWLALKIARDALDDAGYTNQLASRQKTSVIIGKGTYVNRGNFSGAQHSLIIDQTLNILKALHPEFGEAELAAIRREFKANLPPFSAETASGLIPNIIAGRIANRLDLMGPSYTVDAACASSLIAAQLGVRDLLSGECDLALIGGAQVTTPIPILSLFCQLNALSHRQQIRPFDKDADGTILGEGIGMIVLKRREDAVRDGDRIYALLKGVGTASDGHGTSVMAPRVAGEELALRRAYEAAGVDPSSVGLVEAHGTATLVGDAAELNALSNVFGSRRGVIPGTALGTVKSMIGHTMAASGIAGIIKTALALHHRVLPPTLHIAEPTPSFDRSSSTFYLNTDVRPWIHGNPSSPRRAGVNAFGFGGINAHAVLEEFPESNEAELSSHLLDRDSEVFVIAERTRELLRDRLDRLIEFLSRQPSVSLKDLAYSVNLAEPDGAVRIGIVATDLADLLTKLGRARQRLSEAKTRQIKDATGIYFFSEPLATGGKVAVLFPGEGSQYASMLSDLCVHFPRVREAFDQIDRIFHGHPRGFRPSDVFFPPTLLSSADRELLDRRLWQSDGAYEAVLTANHAMWTILSDLGLKPDAVVGHSTGEYSAMRAAGVLDQGEEAEYSRFVLALNEGYQNALATDTVPPAGMLAVGASREKVAEIARQAGGQLYVAMDNCVHQAVLVGMADDVERARELAKKEGLIYEYLTFDRAYHTPLFAPYLEHLRLAFDHSKIKSATLPIYSCTTAAPYPDNPDDIRHLMVDHWIEPVEFRQTIERLYADGFRVFVEAGARGNLTTFVEDILRGRPHCAVASNVQRRSGVTQLNHTVAILSAHGLDLDVGTLFRRRRPAVVDWRDGSVSSTPTSGEAKKLKTALPLLTLSGGLAAELKAVSAAVHKPNDQALHRDNARSLDPVEEVAKVQRVATSHEAGFDAIISEPAARVAQHDNQSTSAQSPLPRKVGVAEYQESMSTEPAVAMDDYFRTMDQFLAVQSDIVQAFLSGNFSDVGDRASVPSVYLDDPTSFTEHAIDPSLPGAEYGAPVGPDDLAPVESSRDVSAGHNAAPAVAHTSATLPARPVEAAVSLSVPGHEALAGLLAHVVVERTGYPIEMLGFDLDVEADLGIDSIKRVEILGAFRRQHPVLADLDLGVVSEQRTLGKIIGAVTASLEQRGLLSRSDTAQAPASSGADSFHTRPAHVYPLIGRVVSFVPGDELVAERTVDPLEDAYLRDHTLGRTVSNEDPDLLALPVMPMMMSLELLAESAAAVLPHLKVVALQDIRAHRWIAFQDEPQVLMVIARRRAGHPNIVDAYVRNLTEDQQADDLPKSPVIEATIVLADEYPSRPPRLHLDLTNPRESVWQPPERLYRDAMFHGPGWQGVSSILKTGDNGTVATLPVLPWTGFFRGAGEPSFVLDPVVLDAAGQVPGFWFLETVPPGEMIFPYRVASIEFYGAQRPVGELLTCTAAVELLGERQVRSDIDVVDADGSLWIRLVGLEDLRFPLPRSLQLLVLDTRTTHLSHPWKEPVARLPTGRPIAARRLEPTLSTHRQFWKRVWADCILSRSERPVFHRMRTPDSRQMLWLAGRSAAKEAVRDLLRQTHHIDVLLADIEIGTDERGRPVVGGAWEARTGDHATVSIAHSGNVAVAVAALTGPRNLASEPRLNRSLLDRNEATGPRLREDAPLLGIDVEERRAHVGDLAELVLSESELQLIHDIPEQDRADWVLRGWCAKEAIGKALGYGLVDGPRSVHVVGANLTTGTIEVELAGQLARVYPEFATTRLIAHSWVEGDVVVATTLCESESTTKW